MTHEAKPLLVCVCLDGRGDSFRALEKTLDLVVKGVHARLVLLMIQPRSTFLEALVDPFDMLHIPDRQLRLFAKKRLAECEARCKKEKVPFETKIVVTDVSEKEELLDQIEAINPDLVVVGRKGMGKVAKLLLGSTADFCARHCPCPVYIAT